MNSVRLLETTKQDLRFAVRTLFKKPLVTLIAIITLALGIGANTAIFSVVNTVLLRPPSFRDPERLVYIWTRTPESEETSTSYADFRDWKERNSVFEDITAMRSIGANLTGDDNPEQVQADAVLVNMFALLGVNPEYGRPFYPEDEQWGQHRVVILSHRLFQRRYGGDPAILDQLIELGGGMYMVIGIMPREQDSFGPAFSDVKADVWVPLVYAPANQDRNLRSQRFLWRVVAKLKPGITVAQADQAMKLISLGLADEHPETNRGWSTRVVGQMDYNTQPIRLALSILMAAVAFVLLIACVNVTSLLLARGAVRSREMAIRAALGASRGRLLVQLLTESAVLAFVAGGVGVLLARLGLAAIVKFGPAAVPGLSETSLDGRVLGFTLIISVLTGIVVGMVPALQTSRIDLQESLSESSRGVAGGRRSHRIFQMLVVSEVSLAVVLLIGAILMVKSYSRLRAVNPGFNPENLLTFQVRLPVSKYRNDAWKLTQQLCEHLAALPGVKAAGTASEAALPIAGDTNGMHGWVVGRPDPEGNDFPMVKLRQVGADYFRALGISVQQGEVFTGLENPQDNFVAVINQSLARRFFPDENPIGRSVWLDDEARHPLRVIGVVDDVKYNGLSLPEDLAVYTLLSYNKLGVWSNMYVLVRTDQDPGRYVGIAREQLKALDKNLPLSEVRTASEIVGNSVSEKRFAMILLGSLAVLALFLAVIGIYGVMSYSVSQQTKEIGIRMALGAQSATVLRLVLGQGGKLIVIGIAVGLAGALALTRLMTSLLYGISGTDPLTYIIVAILLVAVALIACYLPARRALKTDPISALRYE